MNRNLYYHPEQSGLTMVDTLQGWSRDRETQFVLTIWENENQELFWQLDAFNPSGLAVPFEGHYYVDREHTNLEPLTPETYQRFNRAVDRFPGWIVTKEDILQKCAVHIAKTHQQERKMAV